MRRGALIWLATWLAACGPDRYGTYFLADGRGASLAFDHAEFYFGAQIPGAFASPDGPHTGVVYQRRFVDTDTAVPSSGKLATYYLPLRGPSDVGSYVLVVARDASNAIVGAGEALGFSLATGDEVLEIEIPLQATSTVQTWGEHPDCVTWDRMQRARVAVVRDDDRDCDGALASTDCNDLAYCASGDPSCSTTPVVCGAPCSIGCRVGNTCTAATCLFGAVCSPPGGCASITDLPQLFTCLAAQGSVTHLDVKLPVKQADARPCLTSFSVPLPNGAACKHPIIVYEQALSDNYRFSVHEGDTACDFDVNSPSNPQAFVGDHHLLVSIDGATALDPRSSFFFGVLPDPQLDCSSTVSTTNTLAINSCM